ncbi:MAG: right-handed parallel beta-helix repeat-containing protein [Candidatus Omnitrophica bacterium]|nr:right-handed parallel beta-helix repeat-containing protein [Candidatus Omnitrophota bacterium]
MQAAIPFLLWIVLSSPGLNPPIQPWLPKAPPLPPPQGEVIRVSTAEQLFEAAEAVKPGGAILLEDGVYFMPRYFEIRTDGVTLRSASGRRENVILDGSKSMHGELVGITACSGVTIADLTIQNIKWNGFKINSNKNVQNLTIYNCIIHNIWQRGVKSVKVPETDRERIRPKNCRIQYCLFYNDRPKQYSDDPSDTQETFRGNYIGGIDTMYAKGWTISDNVFTGIHGRTGEARGCVFMWHHAEDCIIERNVIIDCDTGIALGNSSGIGPGQSSVHCSNFIVRNNFISVAPENGILADYTKDCQILHNTIYDPRSVLKRLIRIVHDNPGLVVANNLLCGPPMRVESQSAVRFSNNLTGDYASYFADPLKGDLHLTDDASQAIDQGAPLEGVLDDFDRQKRDALPDIGADEFKQLSAAPGRG